MGMAASQARYLALVARKSNCEYEGQQINQARLALSNQSANLFNQMLGLKVPVPPSTQDFTTTQYSFTDGNHTYVVDNWRQLPASDTQYNYIVDTHYFTDVYTGSMRRMVDPQVQIGGSGSGSIAPLSQIQAMSASLRVAEEVMNTKYAFWQSTKSQQEAIIAGIRADAQASPISYSFRNEVNGYSPYPTTTGDITQLKDGDTVLYNISYTDGSTILDELPRMLKLGITSINTLNTDMQRINPNAVLITDPSDIENNATIRDQLCATYALATGTGTNNYKYIAKISDLRDIRDKINDSETGYFSAYQITGNATEGFHNTQYYTDQIRDCETIINSAKEAYLAVKDVYDEKAREYRNLAQPTYIGNSPLTYLDQLTEEQEIELKQVVSDMVAQGIDTDIINCFDEDGDYRGGVYSFQIYGTTYYTTYNNLVDAYTSNPESINFIDDQYRMPYYNASYINTRIDQEARALLETDSVGRFTSIRFENDSATYTLNMETITDEAAYQDAMNQYYYENAIYDKTVQDINAKTSIIHHEDQQLELRLKQLDTEQNALKTEIDAVSKVVKDNVEASFKTFGG